MYTIIFSNYSTTINYWDKKYYRLKTANQRQKLSKLASDPAT